MGVGSGQFGVSITVSCSASIEKHTDEKVLCGISRELHMLKLSTYLHQLMSTPTSYTPKSGPTLHPSTPGRGLDLAGLAWLAWLDWPGLAGWLGWLGWEMFPV